MQWNSKFIPSTVRQSIQNQFQDDEQQQKAKRVVDFIRSIQNDYNKLEYFLQQSHKSKIIQQLPSININKLKQGRPSLLTLKGQHRKNLSLAGNIRRMDSFSKNNQATFNLNSSYNNAPTTHPMTAGTIEAQLHKRKHSSITRSQDYYRAYIEKKVRIKTSPYDKYVRYDEEKKLEFQEKVENYLKQLRDEEKQKELALQQAAQQRRNKEREQLNQRLKSRQTQQSSKGDSRAQSRQQAATTQGKKSRDATPIVVGQNTKNITMSSFNKTIQKLPFPKSFKLPSIAKLKNRIRPQYQPTPSQIGESNISMKSQTISLNLSSPKIKTNQPIEKTITNLPQLKVQASTATPRDTDGPRTRGGTHGNSNTLTTTNFLTKKMQLDRDSTKFHDLFRTICNQTISYKHCKMTRSNLRNYVAKRYDKKIVESMLRGYFDFSHAYTFDQFCNHIDAFLNLDKTQLMKFSFQAFDVNNDGLICEDDIWHVLQTVSADAFEKAFYPDISLVIQMINSKQSDKEPGANKILGMNAKKLATIKRESTRRQMIKSMKDLKRIGLVPEREKGQNISFDEFLKINFPNQNIPHVLDDFVLSICAVSPSMLNMTMHGSKAILQDKDGDYVLGEKDIKELERLQRNFDIETGEYQKIKGVFLKLCAFGESKIVPKNESRAFITKRKISDNLQFALGIKNEFLALRLYDILSEHQADAKIMFPQFIRVLLPLLFGSEQAQHFFTFNIFDQDNDGIINSTDMLDFQKTLVPDCQLMKQLKIIIQEYTDKNIWVKDRKKKIKVTEYYFQKLIEKPALTKELRLKLLGHWDKNKMKSCFESEKSHKFSSDQLNKKQLNTQASMMPGGGGLSQP